ncbi:exosortase family protein XrtG [Anaerocolumna xylanovorans]|uniref:Exosortase family protein XrtG n=1 Tax=Anaerocolumna xylanovorans DSM 12503 TaxID=1121345 RepID=A0A1M7YCJ9_9FIRM|nr:exosortase family protein XrtG [Anaerocolumna xylanovorans]SHO50238.1 exosortase family protein XrtG [Anaerocolumna xylanovorans DSM 12503]
MHVFVFICFILWIYMLTVFHRGKLYFFRFLWGSIGLFLFLMIIVQPVATPVLQSLVSSMAGIIGKITGMYSSYYEYGILFIQHGNSAISLYIDYECSGIIEMMVFVAMVAFFQVYEPGQRVVVGILGCLGIFFANIVRIFTICAIIYFFGNNSYYFAHTIAGRIVFYVMSVGLYYFTFTKAQVVKQKVGGFSYAEHLTDTGS